MNLLPEKTATKYRYGCCLCFKCGGTDGCKLLRNFLSCNFLFFVKKKIAFLTFALARGGTEKVVSILLQELCKDFTVYLILTSRIIEYPVPANVQIHFIDNSTENENLFIRLLKIPLLSYRYYKFCKIKDVDISISFLNRPNYIACMMRFFRWKKKIIISERTSTLLQYSGNNLKSKTGKILVKWLYPKSDLILTNSKANITDLKNHFAINTTLLSIYNPIDLKNILSKKEEKVKDVDFTKFTYIMLGRFVNEKDHGSLLEAFSMLPNKIDCQLLLIGHGKNEHSIRLKAAELKITPNVIFIAFTENPYKYLSKSHCFVLSSIQEGFPNVLIEALSCSLPSISTDCKNGPRELLAPQTDYSYQLTDKMELAEFGILVPVKNSKVLSKAMQTIFNDKILYQKYKQQGIRRAECFDISTIIQEYQNVFNKD